MDPPTAGTEADSSPGPRSGVEHRKIDRRKIVFSDAVWRGFEIVGDLEQVEVVAFGRGVREAARLEAVYGATRWRKLKGVALVRIASGQVVRAEVHSYEADGIGMRELKIKRLVD